MIGQLRVWRGMGLIRSGFFWNRWQDEHQGRFRINHTRGMGERTEKCVRSFQSESGEEWTQGKRWERTMSLRKWRKLGPVEHDRRGAEMGLMLNRFSEARLWAGWGHVGFIPRTVGGPWMILTRAVIWWVLHCFLETGLVSLGEELKSGESGCKESELGGSALIWLKLK